MYGITFEKVKDEVIRLAKETPDRVYAEHGTGDTCSYISDSKIEFDVLGNAIYADVPGKGKGCIFGRALQNLGVSIEILSGMEVTTISNVLDRLGCELSAYQSGTLDGAQERQDFGDPWGELVKLLDK